VEREPDVSEDYIASIFRIEEQIKEEIRKLSLPPASAGFLFELPLDPEDEAIYSSEIHTQPRRSYFLFTELDLLLSWSCSYFTAIQLRLRRFILTSVS
jgi:hypothetical protein